MRAFPLVLSLAALGASAFSIVISLGLAKELRERAGGDPALEARLAKVEEALDAASKPSAPKALAPAPSSRDEAAAVGTAEGAAMGGPSALAAGKKPVTVADIDARLAEIERK